MLKGKIELGVGKGVGLLVGLCIINNIDYTRRREFERNDIEVIWLELL